MMTDEAFFDLLYPSEEWEREFIRNEGRVEGQLQTLIDLIYRKTLKSKTREQIIDELELDEEGIQILDNFDSYTHFLNV